MPTKRLIIWLEVAIAAYLTLTVFVPFLTDLAIN